MRRKLERLDRHALLAEHVPALGGRLREGASGRLTLGIAIRNAATRRNHSLTNSEATYAVTFNVQSEKLGTRRGSRSPRRAMHSRPRSPGLPAAGKEGTRRREGSGREMDPSDPGVSWGFAICDMLTPSPRAWFPPIPGAGLTSSSVRLDGPSSRRCEFRKKRCEPKKKSPERRSGLLVLVQLDLRCRRSDLNRHIIANNGF